MYLGLADGYVVEVGCENEQGIPRALLQSRDERLREWGELELEENVMRASGLDNEDF